MPVAKKISSFFTLPQVADDDEILINDTSDKSTSPVATTKRIKVQDLLAGVNPEGKIYDKVGIKDVTLPQRISAPPVTTDGHIYVKNKKLHYLDPDGIEYLVGTAIANPGTTTPPPTPPGGGSTPNQDPPPTADPVNFTAGNLIFSSTCADLDDFNSTSPVTVGSEDVVVNATGGVGSTPCLEYDVTTIANEVGVTKDLSNNKTRVFKFKFKLDGSATLSTEHTLFHSWLDDYAGDFVQLRIYPSGSGYSWMIRPAQAGAFPVFKRTNNRYAKGTWYDIEFIIQDGMFGLKVDGKTVIDYYGWDNTDKYLGGVFLGKFYSANLSGKFYIDTIEFRQEYVAPTGTMTEAAKLADAYAAWVNRFVRADGAVVRPYLDGIDGLYQPSSDVVSEGIPYGQIYAVQMNDQTTFDLIETWASANLERRHNSLPGDNLMGWHWDDVNGVMYDWNFATDADIDRAMALIWAHYRWGSGGTINYASKATSILTQLKNLALVTDNGFTYMASDSFQLSANPMELNPSYMSVAAFKMFRDFTGDTIWDNVIAGSYDVFNRSTDNSGGIPTTAGLPPDWCGYNTSTNDIVLPPNNRAVKYSYDAFRTGLRIYWHYHLFQNAQALAWLTGTFKQFMETQWNTLNRINAEYTHEGVPIGSYEKSMMTSAAYWAIVANNPSSTIGAAIQNTKLSSTILYKKDIMGGFYRDAPTQEGVWQGRTSYYSDSWMLFHFLIKNGQFINYTA
jgi:endo-1,4-beta-D-glucanase Y